MISRRHLPARNIFAKAKEEMKTSADFALAGTAEPDQLNIAAHDVHVRFCFFFLDIRSFGSIFDG